MAPPYKMDIPPHQLEEISQNFICTHVGCLVLFERTAEDLQINTICSMNGATLQVQCPTAGRGTESGLTERSERKK